MFSCSLAHKEKAKDQGNTPSGAVQVLPKLADAYSTSYGNSPPCDAVYASFDAKGFSVSGGGGVEVKSSRVL
jgi:hypothetical protein